MKSDRIFLMLRYFVCSAMLLSAYLSVFASVESDNLALIDSIDIYSKKYHLICDQKKELIDSLKAMREQMSLNEQRIRLGESLGRRYLSHKLDSALIYWRLAKREADELGDKGLSMRMNMNILSTMPLIGISIEALEEFEKINPEELPLEIRQIYWLDKSELYFNIQKPYPIGEFKDYYRSKAAVALDSLSRYYTYDSPVYQFITANIHQLNGEENLSAASFIKALPQLKRRHELYDFAIANIIDFYRKRPEYRALYLNYLYRRALSQLRNGNVKSQAIAEAGEALLEEGKEKLGMNLMILAMQTDDKRLGPYSNFNYAWYAPLLNQQLTKAQVIAVTVTIILLIILCVIMLRLKHYRSKANLLEQRLSDSENMHKAVVSDMTKVSGSLLSIALFTDEQMKEYNLYIHRKLKAGQVKDLYRDVESGDYVRGLTEKFFAKFDESFLESFPGFVDRLNELFTPGRELSLLPNGRMTPELRIAAFMRLGITDSSKLSQVLGLSINTIYTYRNRLKGRAISRMDFDKNVQTIAFNGL